MAMRNGVRQARACQALSAFQVQTGPARQSVSASNPIIGSGRQRQAPASPRDRKSVV